jgi:carbon monoxide dehydrogenase subunit G
MDFNGTVDIDAPRAAVWALLLDFEQLSTCGPGVQSIEQLDPTHARVKAKIGVAFMTLGFTVDLELVDVEEPNRAVINATGEATGNQVEATGQMRLTGPAGGPTTMTYEATVEIFGSLAGVGSRMIEGTAARLLDETFECIRARLAPAT